VDPFTYAKMLNPSQPDMVIWESIDAMMEQMDGRDTSWYRDDQVLTTTTATGLTVSFTVGYVSWLLRAGYLSASLMSVLPLWREFDPLPVLAARTNPENGRRELAFSWQRAWFIGGLEPELSRLIPPGEIDRKIAPRGRPQSHPGQSRDPGPSLASAHQAVRHAGPE